MKSCTKLSFIFGIIFVIVCTICTIHGKSIEINNEEQEQIEEMDNYVNPDMDMDRVPNSVENEKLELFIPSEGISSMRSMEKPGLDDPTFVKQWTSVPKSEIPQSSNQLLQRNDGNDREHESQSSDENSRLSSGLWAGKAPSRKPRHNKERSKMQKLNRLSYYLGEPHKRQRQNTIIFRQCFFNPISCF